MKKEALKQLEQRATNGTFTVGIYGLGYVGLPRALRFAEVGIRVISFDINPTKISTLQQGGSYIERITPEAIAAAFQKGMRVITSKLCLFFIQFTTISR